MAELTSFIDVVSLTHLLYYVILGIILRMIRESFIVSLIYLLFYSYICKTLKNYFTLRKNADSYLFWMNKTLYAYNLLSAEKKLQTN